MTNSHSGAGPGTTNAGGPHDFVRPGMTIPAMALTVLLVTVLPLPSIARSQTSLPSGMIHQVVVEATDNRPILGPVNAPITILYWLDLSVPYSPLVRRKIAALRQRFPDSVRIVVLPSFSISAWGRSLNRLAWSVFRNRGNKRFWDFCNAIWTMPRRKLIFATVKKLAVDVGGLSAPLVARTLKDSHLVAGSLQAGVLRYLLIGGAVKRGRGRHVFLIADKPMVVRYSTWLNAFAMAITSSLPEARSKMRQGMTADAIARWHLHRALCLRE